jgi:hypothetical protein
MDEQEYFDKSLTCKDCKVEFVFEAGEQRFYEQRGYSIPIRCPDCRKKKKAERENATKFGDNDKPAFRDERRDPWGSSKRKVY